MYFFPIGFVLKRIERYLESKL